MRTLFHRHRVRATFYHANAACFVLSALAWAMGWIDDGTSMVIAWGLWATDYVAEMYDPHPETPGPWFKAHFHRWLGDRADPDAERKTEMGPNQASRDSGESGSRTSANDV